MSLTKLLKTPYYAMRITLRQGKPVKLPYCGPIARGWLSDAVHSNKDVWELLFKNPNVDVRPYYLFTTSADDRIDITINCMGFSSKFIKDLVELLSSKVDSHFGGVPCKIEKISCTEEHMDRLSLEKRIKIVFATPTSITIHGKIQLAPTLGDITAGIVRMANKFCKYYVKKCYPLRVKTSTREPIAKIVGFDLTPFIWRHRSMQGNVIPLEGIVGNVEYEVDKITKELKGILSLTQVVQIGKWISYGFGKIEVS